MLATMTPLAQAGGGGGGTAQLLISLGLMAAIFYFLLIRPQQRRMRQQRQLMESLGVGDDIVTIGGMYGTIRSLDDDSLTVEVASGVSIRIVRSAVARKVTPDTGDEDVEDQQEQTG